VGAEDGDASKMGTEANSARIAVIIPCYRVRATILEVVRATLPFADDVFCVDDRCPEQSGDAVAEAFAGEPAVHVIRREKNIRLFLNHHAYRLDTAGDLITAVVALNTQTSEELRFTAPLFADCTGHGVPGALLSMLGMSYLDEIVQRREITQANQVLNELRIQIKHSLRQHGQTEESRDGIDMALCVFDMKNREMQYAGANNPLYHFRDVNGRPELKEIKADPMPVGYYRGKDTSFTNHLIQLEMGDTFYLFSDGFMDQKGGKENKKFMSKNFKKLLLEIHDHPMYEQKDILDKTLANWMGDNTQMDDVLVIGVRV